MRLFTLGVLTSALTAVVIAVTPTVAQAAPARPTPVTPVPATAAAHTPAVPAAVQARVNSITAHGGTILHLTDAPYYKATAHRPAPLSTTLARPLRTTTSATVARSLDFPSGCGLWVIVYRSGNIIHSDSTTSCLYPVDEIQMLGGIAWSRWWGWDELYQDEDGNFRLQLPRPQHLGRLLRHRHPQLPRRHQRLRRNRRTGLPSRRL
jgi:hypothetical protein